MRKTFSLSARAEEMMMPIGEIAQGFNTSSVKLVHWPDDTKNGGTPNFGLIQGRDSVCLDPQQAVELHRMLGDWLDGKPPM